MHSEHKQVMKEHYLISMQSILMTTSSNRWLKLFVVVLEYLYHHFLS
jgi:hypothetical protein